METNATNVTVSPIVDVAIDLSVDNQYPDIGSDVIITLTIRNYGPSIATNITGKLNKDFLSALRIISIDSSDIKFKEGVLGYIFQEVLTVNEDGSFEIDQLNVDQVVSAAIKAQVLRDGNITVDGVVSSSEKDSNLSNNYDEITMQVHSLVNLSINKTVDNMNPTVGDVVQYTITVANAGPSNATNVVVLEKLPKSVTYISDNGNGAYDYKTGKWNIDSIRANETKSLSIKVKTNKIGKVTNTVNVTSDEDNINIDKNTANVTINVVPKVVDLKIKVDVNNTKPYVGDLVEITITITNKGKTDATGVKVYDHIPKGLKYITDDGDGRYDSEKGIWYIGNLKAGESTVLHIIVRAIKEGNVTYSANVTANEELKDPESAKDNVTLEVINDTPKGNITPKHHDNEKVELRATGNPLALLLVGLLSIGVCLRRKHE